MTNKQFRAFGAHWLLLAISGLAKARGSTSPFEQKADIEKLPCGRGAK